MTDSEKSLVLNLQTKDDTDHVVALYKKNGRWGAISKTNHATLRFRDPIYRNLRELAVSYFHEYFINQTGKKTLRSFSKRPFNLATLGTMDNSRGEFGLYCGCDIRCHT